MKSIITFLIAFALGGAAMFFYDKNQDDQCCGEPPVTDPPQVVFGNIGDSAAHFMSATYRNSIGLCQAPLPTDINYTGVMQLTKKSIDDLKAAITEINDNNRPPNTAKYYRVFMGRTIVTPGDTSSQLLVVGVGAQNNELDNYVVSIDMGMGYLPCPKYCDINSSKIFMGNPPSGNPCQ